MSRKSHNTKLYIYMNGKLVGTLTREFHGQLQFTYDKRWLTSSYARPLSLSMPLTEVAYQGNTVSSYFDNLLPDNDLILERIQARFQTPTKRCFDLLSHIGRDCVGAIQLSQQSQVKNIKSIEALPISDTEIASLLKHYQTAPLGMNHNTDFRISIAGAQEKTALLWHNNAWHLPLNTTPTTHIIKLPIGIIQHSGIDLSDSCENEWLCAQIAKAFGLPTANCSIHQFNSTKALIIERFDRKLSADKKWMMRLPQEDMCQALGISSGLKYQADGGPGIKDIMQLLRGSDNAIQDRETFFRAQILLWLLAAIDGHAKNFSVFIETAGKYRLTPLYDILSAYPLIAKKKLQSQKIKMAMALKSKSHHYHWHNLQRRYFLSAAQDAQFSPELAEKLLDEMLDQVDVVIPLIEKQLPKGFPENISIPIFSGMRAMKQRLIR